VDTLQLSLLDRATECMIILSHMAAYAAKHGPMDGPDLINCLRQSYIAYANTFERLMRTIYEQSNKRPQRGPSLKDYLAQIEADNG